MGSVLGKNKNGFWELKQNLKKKHMKKIIHDYSKFFKNFCNGVGATIPGSHANGPSSIPSVGIPIEFLLLFRLFYILLFLL